MSVILLTLGVVAYCYGLHLSAERVLKQFEKETRK